MLVYYLFIWLMFLHRTQECFNCMTAASIMEETGHCLGWWEPLAILRLLANFHRYNHRWGQHKLLYLWGSQHYNSTLTHWAKKEFAFSSFLISQYDSWKLYKVAKKLLDIKLNVYESGWHELTFTIYMLMAIILATDQLFWQRHILDHQASKWLAVLHL